MSKVPIPDPVPPPVGEVEKKSVIVVAILNPEIYESSGALRLSPREWAI